MLLVDDAQGARAGRERAEVEAERVGLVHDQPLRVRHAARQSGRELAVDLDHM